MKDLQMLTNVENAANVNKSCAMYKYVSGIDPRGDRWYMYVKALFS